MTKPTLSVLLCQDGTFDEMWSMFIKNKYEQHYDVKFTYFKRASELVKLAREQAFDLIILYFGNVNWDVPGYDDFGTLANLKYGKRILVTQGMDFSEQCERAGITFFATPATVQQFYAVLEASLNTPPATRDRTP